MKLFIFGSTGDLVKRKVVPALVKLNPDNLEIIALGRKDFTDEMYEDFVCDDKCFRNFNKKPLYHKIEFGNEIVCERCGEFLSRSEDNFFYIAMPPKIIENIIVFLGKVKKQGFKIRALIEKPFGDSLENAKNLEKLLRKNNLEGDIFISDHYLFKKEVVSLDKMEFKNIKIVSLESVGLEKRGYYDEIGALKDMVQSHFLNIVFKLLENSEEEFSEFSVLEYLRAQYGNGKDKGYVVDLGKKSDTESFVRIKLKTKTKEISFITGKRFDKKLGFIEIDGKRVYFKESENPYEGLFLDFFSGRKENFPGIKNSVLAWEIIEKIQEEKKKNKLGYYREDSSSEEVVEDF